jgi:thiamine biosynthesis protein ThiS
LRFAGGRDNFHTIKFRDRRVENMKHSAQLTANGKNIEAMLPGTIEEFLLAQKLLPRSVVVEHNGEAVAPSEFSRRTLRAGDRLEIVKIVAGG